MYNMARKSSFKGLRKYLFPILLVVIGLVIGSTMLCGCKVEGMQVRSSVPYTLGGNSMSEGVPGTGTEEWRNEHNPYNHGEMQVKEGGASSNMFMFANNKFSHDCCNTSSISSSNGCACITKEQQKLLGTRGGNCAHGNCSF